jgi:hypothetical protein
MARYTGDAPAYDAGIAEQADGFRGVMFPSSSKATSALDEVMSGVLDAGGTILEAAH